MSKVVLAFDMAAYKYGACVGSYPDRAVQQPTRFEAPATINAQAFTPDERAWATLKSALKLIKAVKPDVVLLEDCTIQFITKGADGKPIFKSKGKQDYHVKRNIGFIEGYCRLMAKIEVELINIGRLNLVCLGNGRASKKDGQDAMSLKYGIKCPTDDHSDAAKIVDYYFLTH